MGRDLDRHQSSLVAVPPRVHSCILAPPGLPTAALLPGAREGVSPRRVPPALELGPLLEPAEARRVLPRQALPAAILVPRRPRRQVTPHRAQASSAHDNRLSSCLG